MRSGTKTPFKPTVEMGEVNVSDTRADIYNNMVRYERRLRGVAQRFNVNGINKLPKTIYDSRIITALKKIRDNQAPSMMGPDKLLPVLPGLPEVGNFVPAPTGVTADPLNAMSQTVARGIDDRILFKYDPILDDIDDAEAAIDATIADLEAIIKNMDDKESKTPTPTPSEPVKPAEPLEEKEVNLENTVDDDFLEGILDVPSGNTYNRSDMDALKLWIQQNSPYKDIAELKSKATTWANDRFKNKNINISDDFIRSILNEVDADGYTRADVDALRNYLTKNRPYSSTEDLRSKAIARARLQLNKLKPVGPVSNPSDRPAQPTTTEQLIPDKGSKFLLTSTGSISARSITGEELVLMMDGTWEVLDPNILRNNPSSPIQMPIDENGQIFTARTPPRGVSQEQWNQIRKQAKDENERNKKKPLPPLPPITKPIPKKDEDPPPPPEDPRFPRRPRDPNDKTPLPKVNLNNKNRTRGISALRPFFSTYHGLDILTQTDKEAIEDIKEYDLFDVPIPENDNLDNPLFVKNLRAQMLRFSGSGDPSNVNAPVTVRKFITSEILSSNVDGSLMLERLQTDTIYIDRGVPTQNPVDIENPYLIPTIIGGLKDGVPWSDPNKNNYSRGFGEANRTEASYPASVVNSLYANPEIYNAMVTNAEPFKT
jgi:hypothetical protein